MSAVPEDPPKPALPPAEISDEALHWIMRLHSGTATADDLQAFKAWRALSNAHEKAAQEAEALWADAGYLHIDPSTGTIRPGHQTRGTTRRSLLIGVAGVLTVSGGFIATANFRNRRADVQTGTRETRIMTLADGSRVTLNANSGLDMRFSETARRIVLLYGQAFFEVEKDAKRPFEVEVGGTLITALGTAFDIDRNLEKGGLTISVTEHAVAISDIQVQNRSQDTAESLMLSEGQAVTISANGHVGDVAARREAVTAAWRNGKYIAENVSLGDVVAALRNYHAGWIIIRGNDTASLPVSAVLDLKATDASLDALAQGLPISVTRLSPYLVVISAD